MLDSYILLIISAELDFLGSAQYYESLYRTGSIDKRYYVKRLTTEKAKKDAQVEEIRKHLEEKTKEAEGKHE